MLDAPFKRDFERVKKAVLGESDESLKSLNEEFRNMAEEYASPWYDEDLEIYRGGYDWESKFYRDLAWIVE